VSADLFDRHLAIPMHANLTDEDLDHVIDTVRAVVGSATVRRR
jgi:dTDP-4-amino-4,6-dideoxygalactose transaminase